jgi:protein-S-isoprenylcysteine O-methyltransferase Ste14
MTTAKFISKIILSVIYITAIFGALLFVPAGTLHWTRAWMFLGVNLVATIVVMLAVFRSREGLLNERFKPALQKGQPLTDKIVVSLLLVAFYGLVVFIPLDVFRFHLMSKPNGTVSVLGLVVYLAGWVLVSFAFRENSFAAPVVKHQTERDHRVVDTGVYRVVRHPMYAGMVLLSVGMSLWLESYAAALAAIIPIAVVAARILVEERFLRRKLPGYVSYSERVRYRLIPFLW